jgi:hypothetical protein
LFNDSNPLLAIHQIPILMASNWRAHPLHVAQKWAGTVTCSSGFTVTSYTVFGAGSKPVLIPVGAVPGGAGRCHATGYQWIPMDHEGQMFMRTRPHLSLVVSEKI